MPEQGLTIFRNGQFQVSKRFDNANLPTTGLDEGLSAGFARITYKGGKWGIRYQGEYIPYEITLNNGQKIDSPYLDIVLLDTAKRSSKAWYEGAYTEGQMGPPDCYSANGIVPDPASRLPQSRTCKTCPHDEFGSKINAQTGEAMKSKACQDMKRVAVVPVGDIENVALGGPMMLSVPPSSFKRLVAYQGQLRGMGVNYATVWTRVSFVKNLSYPLMEFDAMAGLNDDQADQVLKMREHPLIERILNAGTAVGQDETPAPEVPAATARPAVPAAPRQMSSAAQPTPVQPANLPSAVAVTPSEEAQNKYQGNQQGEPGLPENPPPGVDPAQWAQFLAMQNAPQRQTRRGRAPSASGVRTPVVSPQPTNSEVVTNKQKETAAAAQQDTQPQPATPAAPGVAINKLMDTIGKMV